MPSVTCSDSALQAATQHAASVDSTTFVYGRLNRKLVRQMQRQSAPEHQAVVWSTHDIAQRVLLSRRAHAKWKNKLKATLGQKRSVLQRSGRAQCLRK